MSDEQKQPDERAAWDGDSEESRAAFRAYDSVERARLRSKWQVWRDACAWQAARATAPQSVKGDEAAGFDLSLASIDAYDPQSFINGAKWAFARAAAPQAGAPNDAAITACALMIKGICMTLTQDQWSRKIEERIRFMLATPQAEK